MLLNISDDIPVWLNAVILLTPYCPTVFSQLVVHLYGSSLADDQQAADGSGRAGAAVDCQDTRASFLRLLQQHWAATVKDFFLLCLHS